LSYDERCHSTGVAKDVNNRVDCVEGVGSAAEITLHFMSISAGVVVVDSVAGVLITHETFHMVNGRVSSGGPRV